jgi:hypothetical protein
MLLLISKVKSFIVLKYTRKVVEYNRTKSAWLTNTLAYFTLNQLIKKFYSLEFPRKVVEYNRAKSAWLTNTLAYFMVE